MHFSYQNIWKITYPILISLFMEQLVGITDVIYLGRLSEADLGAAALGSTYFIMLFMAPFGFSVGARIIMARRNGEGNLSQIGHVFYQGCFFLILLSLVFVALSYFLSGSILNALVTHSEIGTLTTNYVNWRVWGLLPVSLLVMIQGFFVAVTKTRILTWISAVMVFSNVFLNYVLIFGRFGFPRMEISGAALASNIAEVIAIGVYVVYFLARIDLKKYGLDHWLYKNFRVLADILKISIWTMIQEFVSILTWFLFFVAIEHLGSTELAISNIIRTISAFPYIAVHALAATASSVTSNLIGLKLSSEVLATCRRIIFLGVFLMLPVLILMALGAPLFLRIFTDDLSLAQASYAPYMVMLTTFIPLLPGWVLFSAVSGTGQTRKAFYIELCVILFYSFYVWLTVLYLKLPLAMAWGADFVYGAFILAFSSFYMRFGSWQNKKV